jgi:hypothetical protein
VCFNLVRLDYQLARPIRDLLHRIDAVHHIKRRFLGVGLGRERCQRSLPQGVEHGIAGEAEDVISAIILRRVGRSFSLSPIVTSEPQGGRR